MSLHGCNLIAGQLSGEGEELFTAIDPATGEPLEPSFHAATAAEIDRAARLAAEAFDGCRRRKPREIAALLEEIAGAILELGDGLIRRAVAETALPPERIAGERMRTVSQLRMFANLVREGSWVDARIDTALPDRRPISKPDLRQVLIGIGPVAVFAATNFPLAFSVAGGDTASALAAGNPIIVKANGSHPGTSELVGGAIQRAVGKCGMPEGIFSLLHGPRPEVGLGLVGHPGIKAVGFTGSFRGGRALWEAAQRRPEPIPIYAEMGSVNPTFLFPAALAQRAEALAAELAGSVNLGVGQFCTKPGTIFAIAGEALDRFTQRMAQLVGQIPGRAMLNRAMQSSYSAACSRFKAIHGVRLLAESPAGTGDRGTQVGAALWMTDAATFASNPQLGEEMFGPSTLVVACPSIEQMLALARGLPGQLTATVHATPAEMDQARPLLAILETKAGRLLFGGVPTGVEVCPSMVHGGPYPATLDSHSTSVGTRAILRFARPVCYQNCPQEMLPAELRDQNERGIWRLVNGELTRASIGGM